MNVRRTPWWVWLVAAFVLLRVFDLRMPLVPLVIVGVVLVSVLGRRDRRGRVGPPPPSDPQGVGAQTETDRQPPMPTIEVPPYPGTGAGGRPGGQPGGEPPASGAGWSSPDPVVSLGQLHLSRAGHDLQHAAAHGTATELTRVLDEIRDLVGRMQGMISAASGPAESGRTAFGQGLSALDRQVREARGENPPGAKVARVAQTCLRMGQTGRHE